MSTHGPHGAHSRNVSLWQQHEAAGRAARRPTPSAAAVGAAPLLLALFDALGGAPSPCADDAELWTSDLDGDVLLAVEGCQVCPAREACLAYGLALGATSGTWGGQHLGADRQRRPSTTNDLEIMTA